MLAGTTINATPFASNREFHKCRQLLRVDVNEIIWSLKPKRVSRFSNLVKNGIRIEKVLDAVGIN